MKERAKLLIVGLLCLFLAAALFVVINQKMQIRALEKENIDLLAADPNQIPRALWENILIPTEKWVTIYGDDLESRMTFNIAMIIRTLNDQGRVLKLLSDEVFDPNGVK